MTFSAERIDVIQDLDNVRIVAITGKDVGNLVEYLSVKGLKPIVSGGLSAVDFSIPDDVQDLDTLSNFATALYPAFMASYVLSVPNQDGHIVVTIIVSVGSTACMMHAVANAMTLARASRTFA